MRSILKRFVSSVAFLGACFFVPFTAMEGGNESSTYIMSELVFLTTIIQIEPLPDSCLELNVPDGKLEIRFNPNRPEHEEEPEPVIVTMSDVGGLRSDFPLLDYHQSEFDMNVQMNDLYGLPFHFIPFQTFTEKYSNLFLSSSGYRKQDIRANKCKCYMQTFFGDPVSIQLPSKSKKTARLNALCNEVDQLLNCNSSHINSRRISFGHTCPKHKNKGKKYYQRIKIHLQAIKFLEEINKNMFLDDSLWGVGQGCSKTHATISSSVCTLAEILIATHGTHVLASLINIPDLLLQMGWIYLHGYQNERKDICDLMQGVGDVFQDIDLSALNEKVIRQFTVNNPSKTKKGRTQKKKIYITKRRRQLKREIDEALMYSHWI